MSVGGRTTPRQLPRCSALRAVFLLDNNGDDLHPGVSAVFRLDLILFVG